MVTNFEALRTESHVKLTRHVFRLKASKLAIQNYLDKFFKSSNLFCKSGPPENLLSPDHPEVVLLEVSELLASPLFFLARLILPSSPAAALP